MSDLLKRLDKLAGRLLATTQFGPSAHTVLEAKADIERLTAYAEALVALLKESKQPHYECEDSWYSCPKSKEGCTNTFWGDDCNCGADAWNAKVDALLSVNELDTSNPTPAGKTQEERAEVPGSPTGTAGSGTIEVTGVGHDSDGNFCPHCHPCRHRERLAALEDALRSLASYVGNGGYNAPSPIDAAEFEAKVRDGIDHLRLKSGTQPHPAWVALHNKVDELFDAIDAAEQDVGHRPMRDIIGELGPLWGDSERALECLPLGTEKEPK